MSVSVDARDELKPSAYHYPWGQVAAIQKVFAQASIPSLNWGDHVLGYHGANQCCLMVALVVQDGDLEKATEILVDSGFEHCPCKDDVRHLSDPAFYNDFSAHFLGPGGEIHLCASSLLHDLVPLTGCHPNPLGLLVKEYNVLLTGERTRPIQKATQPESEVDSQSPELYAVVRFLDPRSVTMIHLHLNHITSEQKLLRAGLGLAWEDVVFMMAAYVDVDHRILGALPDGPLRSDYLNMMRGLYPTSNLQ